jgi:hypothetical protein
MALVNMKVFNEDVQGMTIETLAQMVDKFNAASNNAIVLTSQGFQGDYRFENFFQSLQSAQRRVDRYATNSSASATNLAQLQEIGVKVGGGFGPVQWEPGIFGWIQKDPAAALESISRNLAESIMRDQLNTAIGCACAAIEAQSTPQVNALTTGAITYAAINNAHAKFGDSSSLLVADIMDGVQYHALVGQNLTNSEELFNYQGVLVVEILGKRVVVTDAPRLRTTGTGGKTRVLSLVAGGVTIYDGSDLITNIETSNGLQRIVTTMQADYSFGVAVKGFQWDVANGGKSPTDAELVTGSNWDKIATSLKHTAGVLTTR